MNHTQGTYEVPTRAIRAVCASKSVIIASRGTEYEYGVRLQGLPARATREARQSRRQKKKRKFCPVRYQQTLPPCHGKKNKSADQGRFVVGVDAQPSRRERLFFLLFLASPFSPQGPPSLPLPCDQLFFGPIGPARCDGRRWGTDPLRTRHGGQVCDSHRRREGVYPLRTYRAKTLP